MHWYSLDTFTRARAFQLQIGARSFIRELEVKCYALLVAADITMLDHGRVNKRGRKDEWYFMNLIYSKVWARINS